MLFSWQPVDAASTALPAPVTYTDGSVAQARPECDAGDLCGSVMLANGDEIRIYNRGAKKCRPFTLELVTLHGSAVVLRSEVETATRPGKRRDCPEFANTNLALNARQIRVAVFLARDGALFVEFLPGTQ